MGSNPIEGIKVFILLSIQLYVYLLISFTVNYYSFHLYNHIVFIYGIQIVR